MNINQLHDILYDILYAIDDACKAENVSYFLDSGTMLGAVRHHGIIPWDDDIDIAVMDRDYDSLAKALIKHLPDYYKLVEPSDLSPHFFDFITRVEDMRYTWHTPTDQDSFFDNKQNHICVDIMVYSSASNTKAGTKWYQFICKTLYGFAMHYRYPGGDFSIQKHTMLQKMQITILKAIGALIPIDKIYKIYRYHMLANNQPKKFYTQSNYPLDLMNMVIHKDLLESFVRIPFGDRELPVLAGYDTFLTLRYGDYMTPVRDNTKYKTHMDYSE